MVVASALYQATTDRNPNPSIARISRMTRCILHRQNINAFRLLLLLVVSSLASFPTDALMVAPLGQRHASTVSSSTSIGMAGYGGASSSSSKKKKKKTSTESSKKPLKPRKQWGLFLGDDLKDADTIRVAVRPLSGIGKNKWFEVGAVKSKDNAHTDAAVIRHRSLINDHARRMFPTQILANDKLEYGYTAADDGDSNDDASEEDWTLLTKVEQIPENIDTIIGFKGNPDPSGFYAFTEGTGLKAGDNTDQHGYLNMKSKAITGHTGHEIHD